MGLAAPRKKTKISHDPNNTNWFKSKDNFGHKILVSQGWTPGSYLGAHNAAHADKFTAASASHIRVSLKDDTLGLGAKPTGAAMSEPTGLGAFTGLLGRLNGQTDAELEEQQRKRDDVNLARYVATNWQSVRFVRGGLLVQEKPKTLPAEKSNKSRPNDVEQSVAADRSDKDRQENTGNTDVDPGIGQETQPPVKVSRKKTHTERSDEKATKSQGRSERKNKKRKRDKKKDTASGSGEPTAPRTEEQGPETKQERSPSSPKLKAVSRERRPVGRNLLRGRHIEQKKRALLDDRSLGEIFMVKS